MYLIHIPLKKIKGWSNSYNSYFILQIFFLFQRQKPQKRVALREVAFVSLLIKYYYFSWNTKDKMLEIWNHIRKHWVYSMGQTTHWERNVSSIATDKSPFCMCLVILWGVWQSVILSQALFLSLSVWNMENNRSQTSFSPHWKSGCRYAL